MPRSARFSFNSVTEILWVGPFHLTRLSPCPLNVEVETEKRHPAVNRRTEGQAQ